MVNRSSVPTLPPTRRLATWALQGAALALLASVGVVLWTVDESTWAHLRAWRWETIAALLALVAVSYLFQGARVLVLTRAAGHTIPYRRCLTQAFATQFGIATTPGGVGGPAIRVGMMHREGVPVPTGVSLVGADYVVDALVYALLLPAAAVVVWRDPFWHGLADAVPRVESAVLGIGLLALGGIVFATVVGARSLPEPEAKKPSGRFRIGAREAWSSLCSLARHRRRALALDAVLAALQLATRFGTLPVVLLSFGVVANPLPLIALQGALATVASLIVLPGGGGSVEAGAALILGRLIDVHLVGVVVVLWRLFAFHLPIALGGVVFFAWTRRIGRAGSQADAGGPTT
jgi:uncharacterized membrane protein YbhN (UPF0104 family)